ncbi:MAG: aminotransferase class III-fold pyridoxal phosphate-dependent enzyme [Myxococcales bacterium]|nr:aminotransferase class III-fold pyridoxal phosphate-dependent enzyme [Myxococcales bacterium]
MNVLEVKAPAFSLAEAEGIAKRIFGVSGSARALVSERDQNFQLRSDDGREYVLKIANPAEDPAVLDFQTQAFLHIARVNPELPVPHLVATAEGAPSCVVDGADGRRFITRLLGYLPGGLLEQVRPSRALLRDVGASAARLGQALRGYFHPAARHELLWDLTQAPSLRDRTHSIDDPEIRRMVEGVLDRLAEQVLPALEGVRAQVIHNDVSCQNTLVEGDRVVGVIDFGDLIHAPLVCDLAVPISELIVEVDDPFGVAMEIAAGYCAVEPLTAEEIAVVFDLVAARTAMAIAISAWRVGDHPENHDYITAGIDGSKATLAWLLDQRSDFFHACLRNACGLPATVSVPRVADWLIANANAAGPIFDRDLAQMRKRVLSNQQARESRSAMGAGSAGLFDEIDVGLHPYGAPGCGADPHHASGCGEAAGGDPSESGGRHLGTDLFAARGTAIHAPLAGVVHRLAPVASKQDLRDLILEHEVADGIRFYTCYRNLAPAEPDGLRPGASVAKGDRIGRVSDCGAPLHFQILTDALEISGGFPRVCEPDQWAVWRDLSPDPNAILKIPEEAFAPQEDELEALLARRVERLGPGLTLFYDRPLQVVRAHGAWLIDASGRAFLDVYNNVPQVGHCHPAVVEALSRQAATLNTNTRYVYKSVLEYADRLTATMPGDLSVCMFVCSGSEANDLAWRLAKAHTGNDGGIVMEDAYHGTTEAVNDLSPAELQPGESPAPHIATVPPPDGYRGPHRRDEPGFAERYADHLDDVIASLAERGRAPAAFYLDLILCSNGIMEPPPGYLRAAFAKVRAAGGLCVADEVQSGFGRTGAHFWGFEAHGVIPDIVTLGKPIGNGYSMAAVVTTPEIVRSFVGHAEFFSTTGGNPVACAVGLAVLDVLEREKLRENADRVGAYLRSGLESLADRHRLIGDVRGAGLFVGVELVRDRKTLEPAREETHAIVNGMREDGVLVGIEGAHRNVLKMRPPLVFSEANADQLIASLDRALEAI